MKRFTLSLTLALIGAIAFTSASPAFGQRQQRSSADSLHELVQYNRDARNKK